jgi:hypothetical protein
MTVPYLEMMYGVAKIVGPRPSRELDLVRALVTHFIPDVTDEQMARILEARKSNGSQDSKSVLLDPAMLELAMDGVPEEDAEDVAVAVKKAAKANPSGHKLPGPPSEGGGATGGSASSRGAPAGGLHIRREAGPRTFNPRPMVDGRLSIEWARELVPLIRGCKLEIDEVKHSRWKVEYPIVDAAGHRIHSKVWNAETSALQALQDCLEWVWALHFLKTGQKCPFRIEQLPTIALFAAPSEPILL